jgi:CBS domain-containing protein
MVGREHLPALAEDDGLDAAIEALRLSPLRRALVLDGERLVGLLSQDDVARALGTEQGPAPHGPWRPES